MSIASELTALKANIEAAKEEITRKGGTTGDTGAAGLAAEIMTIPIGGGEVIPDTAPIQSSFGVLYWYENTYQDWTVDYTMVFNCLVRVVDKELLGKFVERYHIAGSQISFNYQPNSNEWVVSAAGGTVRISNSDMPTTVGWETTILDPNGSATASGILGELPFDDSPVIFAELTSADYSRLFSNSGDFTVTVNGVTKNIPRTIVYRYDFGTINSTNLDDYFMANSSVRKVFTDYAQIERIGASFLKNCVYFNSKLDLSSIRQMSAEFLYGCISFDSDVTFNPNYDVQLMAYFMYYCASFNHSLDAGHINRTDTYFMCNCVSFNQPLSFDHIQGFGPHFMENCVSFDSAITFGQQLSYTEISGFMNGCSNFTQPIDFAVSNYSTISFGQYGSFMNMDKWMGPLKVAQISGGNSDSFTTTNAQAKCYTVGITITGQGRNNLMSMCPNRNTSPYRKLNDGGNA